MTDKTKNILKILAAAVITVVYFRIACWAGNIIALIFLPLSGAFVDDNDVLTWVFCLAPSVLLFTFIDNLLFDPLCRLFKRPAFVYAVLSGNFMTLRGIIAMIEAAASSGERYSGLEQIAALLLTAPVVCLLCGVLFCFLIRLCKKLKVKEAIDNWL